MKICAKCGAYNSDDRKLCVDCGSMLSDSLSASEEQQMRQEIGMKLDELYNGKDPLYVGNFERVIGVLSLVGAVAALLLIVMGWAKEEQLAFAIFSIVAYLVSAVQAFFPRISWEIEKLRLSFKIDGADDLTPNDFYFYGKRVSLVVLMLFGTGLLIMSLL